MNWRQFAMDLESLDADSVEAILSEHGARSVTFTDAGAKPVLEPPPGATPLWQDTRVTGLFAADTDLRALEDELKNAFGLDELPPFEISELEDRAWEREWLRDFGPMKFGRRLWILPGRSLVDADDAVTVRLDPGLAFGTGTHATTALCLEWLDGADLEGKTVLDYGCGSGVLAIAALKLGCARAVATDIDPQAIRATEENARTNDVADRLDTVPGPDTIEGEFDVVVANILAAPLVDLAEAIAARVGPGCSLVLSGILSGQTDDVRAAYQHRIEFGPVAERQQDGQTWARLTGRRTGG